MISLRRPLLLFRQRIEQWTLRAQSNDICHTDGNLTATNVLQALL